jgi:hypothetical protein
MRPTRNLVWKSNPFPKRIRPRNGGTHVFRILICVLDSFLEKI